jgi:hypothetical protein
MQIARIVVLDDRDAAIVRPLHERLASCARDRRGGRIVRVRHQVEALRAGAGGAIERLQVGSLVVGGNPDEPGARGREEVDGARVGRIVDEERVARIEERASDEVQGLLAPRGHEHVLRRRRHAVAREIVGDQRTEARDAVARCVLEGLRADCRNT